MQTRTIIAGIVLGMVVVAGPIGALAAVDELNGPGTPNVSVERINDTHAAVFWTTEEPAHGGLVTYVQPECHSSWIAVNSINDSSFSRTHHVVAPIYELNETKTKRALTNHSEEFEYNGESPKQFKVSASVYTDGSDTSEITNHSERYDFEFDGESPERFEGSVSIYTDGSSASETVMQRTLNGTCQ